MALLQNDPTFADLARRVRALEEQTAGLVGPAGPPGPAGPAGESATVDVSALEARIVVIEAQLAHLGFLDGSLINYIDGSGDVRRMLRLGPDSNPAGWVPVFTEIP